MSQPILMKDGLNSRAVARIALAFKLSWPQFADDKFRPQALQGLENLELKQRVNHLILVLQNHLPEDFATSAKILEKVPANWPAANNQDLHPAFAAWPVIDYVSYAGIDSPDLALPLLAKLTSLFSAEFAARPFIQKYPDISLAFLQDCCSDSNEHIRRWASEGSRPLLPWGVRLENIWQQPQLALPILEALRNDSSKYVQKSVANHLNDIGKTHPQLLLDHCEAWNRDGSDATRWIIRHALRSRIKAGDRRAFELLGYAVCNDVAIKNLRLTPSTLAIGKELAFEFELVNSSAVRQRLILDYRLRLPRQRGTGEFVFKLRDISLKADDSLHIRKKHSFRPITTRRYYPGQCQLELIVNGNAIESVPFELT